MNLRKRYVRDHAYPNAGEMRKIIAEAPANHLAFDVEMVSETKTPGKPGCVSRLVRLWRNHLGLQFTYVGHEVLNRIKDANADVKIVYGYSAAHRGDPDRMIRILQKGLVEQPDCSRYMFYLAREWTCRKDYPKAIELYERYLTVGKFAAEVAEAHLQVAKCYAALKDWKHAKEHTIGAICVNSEFKEALLFASWLFGPKNGAAWKRYASTATNADVMFIRC
jgi:tetratricopeptide (TPR) repeat protein